MMAETLNDVKYRALGALGYSGTLNERQYQFYANGTSGGGGDTVTWAQVTGKPTLMTQATAAPASPTSAGTPGQYFITSDALYICVATDTWRQSTLTEWTP